MGMIGSVFYLVFVAVVIGSLWKANVIQWRAECRKRWPDLHPTEDDLRRLNERALAENIDRLGASR